MCKYVNVKYVYIFICKYLCPYMYNIYVFMVHKFYLCKYFICMLLACKYLYMSICIPPGPAAGIP